MSNDIHIVSLIVYVSMDCLDDVLKKSKQLPEAECHHNEGDHKFIIVYEAESESALTSQIDQINNWRGVLSTQLCYHHCEPNESLLEEIRYATHTS
jgi:nitrate reductase NapAB chaperone NapD